MKLIKKSKEFNLDEIDNLMLLNHPNILKLYEYYYDEKENLYIITEYIRGEELFNKIQENGAFSEVDSAIIIKSVFQAIAYCHSRGIIHRDLKPENILVPTGKSKIDYTLLKIIDFGASVLKKDDGKISFRFGTPYYIAPEVLLESYNEKCDVWSIGVILYLLLLGQAPFDGDDDNIICQKIIQDEVDYNNSKIKSLSPEAVDFMKKLLEKDPEKRISSSQALEHAWLKKFAPHTKVNRAFSRKIYKNLSNFREESQLSTAVVTFITNYLMSDDELKLLKKMFFELDVKGVGVITREELFKGMEECFDRKITREEVDEIFGNIDYDNNGTISFDEFVKAAIDKKKLLTEEKLKAAFSLFDRNGDGDIEAKELKEVIGDDNTTEDNVWMQMIKEVDLDGNGVIDFEEFKAMMKKLCS
jgi:calcium-dependent protein kinase